MDRAIYWLQFLSDLFRLCNIFVCPSIIVITAIDNEFWLISMVLRIVKAIWLCPGPGQQLCFVLLPFFFTMWSVDVYESCKCFPTLWGWARLDDFSGILIKNNKSSSETSVNQCSAKTLEKWELMTHTIEKYGDTGNFSGVTYVILPFINLKFGGTWAPTAKIVGDIPDFNVLNVPKTQPRHNPG